MTFKDTLYTALLNDPMGYPNALDAYIGMFAAIGPYEWQDGELINTQPLPNKTHTDMEDAVRQCVKECEKYHEVTMRMLSDSSKALDAETYEKLKEHFIELREKEKDELVGRIRDTSGRMDDLSVRTSSKSYVPIREETFFYPLSKTFSAICNLPDDIKPDWLDAAERFYGILLENRPMVTDSENTLPSVGERIRELRRAGEKRAQE